MIFRSGRRRELVAMFVAKTGASDVALIGLVCVRPDHREQGLSSELLARVKKVGPNLGCNTLMLWTTKPELYSKFGFQTDQVDYHFEILSSAIHDRDCDLIDKCTIDGVSGIGVPPFGKSIQRVTARYKSARAK